MRGALILRLWNKLVIKAGGKLDVYGELNIKDGATVTGLPQPEATPDATTEVKGLVKQGVAVADAAGEYVTAAEFKALLDSLRASGAIANAAAAEGGGDS